MSYTLASPQPPNLAANETAVTLDSGQIIAVRATCEVQPNSGNPVIIASARQIDAHGNAVKDPTGQPITSSFSHAGTQADITLCGSIQALQKCVLMAMLGEPTAPMWTDPSCSIMLANASIRTAIASAAHAGPVNAGALL